MRNKQLKENTQMSQIVNVAKTNRCAMEIAQIDRQPITVVS